MSTCPKPTPQPCPTPVCPPPPPLPPCLVKPIMRGLHRKQTMNIIRQAVILSVLCGASFYAFVALPRQRKYHDYYLKGEFEDWADEMARKGLFQSVPVPPRN